MFTLLFTLLSCFSDLHSGIVFILLEVYSSAVSLLMVINTILDDKQFFVFIVFIFLKDSFVVRFQLFQLFPLRL